MERVWDVKQRSSHRKGPSEEEVSIFPAFIFTYDFNFVFALYVHIILFLLPVLSLHSRLCCLQLHFYRLPHASLQRYTFLQEEQ